MGFNNPSPQDLQSCETLKPTNIKQGIKHSIKKNASYFLTITVCGWVDVFTRSSYSNIIIESLRYCIQHKGLNVYAYCIMSNHLNLIVNADEPSELKDTIRDFKKFTSKAIIEEIKTGDESRKEWMLRLFRNEARKSKKHKDYKFWKTGNHAIEVYGEKFTCRKVNYIHQNPVKAGYVKRAEDWIFSSASNYTGLDETVLKEVICWSPKVNTF